MSGRMALAVKIIVFLIIMAALVAGTRHHMRSSIMACSPKELSQPYAKWNFSASHFNGKSSYAKIPLDFNGWDSVSISLLAKPERKTGRELSVILDNGHDTTDNFVVQSADANNPNSGRWVWHCGGNDIVFTMPFDKWSQLIVVAEAGHGITRVYINGEKAGEVKSAPFKLGSTPLTVGKLSSADKRYYKGSIGRVDILNRAVEDKEVLEDGA